MGGIVSSLVGSGGDDERSADSDGPVIAVHSKDRWDSHLEASREHAKLMVVHFSAEWCGPCHFMRPAFQSMACRFAAEFVKIDVDELPEVAKAFHIEEMPTFVLVRGGKEVTRVRGANRDELERTISQYCSLVSAT